MGYGRERRQQLTSWNIEGVGPMKPANIYRKAKSVVQMNNS